MGSVRGTMRLGLDPMSCRIITLRGKPGRPQVLSTSRHITQGGVECKELRWDPPTNILSGKHHVIGGNPYILSLHIPEGYTLIGLEGVEKSAIQQDYLLSLRVQASSTSTVSWHARFHRQ